MPRSTNLNNISGLSGSIILPKDMNKASWKIIIYDSNNTSYDVTDNLLEFNLSRVSRDGVSNFTFRLNNNAGVYVNKFIEGNHFDLYYDYKIKSELTTIRFRGFFDGIYDNFDIDSGFTLDFEGRDIPKGETNEHFVDSFTTQLFVGTNVLECFVGTSGQVDTHNNYSNGILYLSGLILKVYNPTTSTWVIYNDLTSTQKTTLKSNTYYNKNHYNTYTDTARVSISKTLCEETDLEFRIEYDSSADAYYFMLFPEDYIVNTLENVSAAQNLLSVNRYGKDSNNEFNRIKYQGKSDDNILSVSSANDLSSQTSLWIKDKILTDNSVSSTSLLQLRATSTLNIEKDKPKSGTMSCCVLPTLQPGEKININIPYIFTGKIKIKSYNLSLSTDMICDLTLQEYEPSLSKMFRNQIDASSKVTLLDNPNNMSEFVLYDFTTSSDYTLTHCIIDSNNKLTLDTGQSTGVAVTTQFDLLNNVQYAEIRIKGNYLTNCLFRLSNNAVLFTSLNVYGITNLGNLGNNIVLEITLNQDDEGNNPVFEKICVGMKK